MKFNVTATGITYSISDAAKLETLGFTFREAMSSKKWREKYPRDQSVSVEISTIEDLLALHEKLGPLVLEDGKIEIYNDYRE